MIKFACFSPHPPLLLPGTGSQSDKEQVKKTIESLRFLAKKLTEAKPDTILISSPHPDWGWKVPWHFLSSKLKIQNSKLQFKIQSYQALNNISIDPSDDKVVYPLLTSADSPEQHFEWGKKIFGTLPKTKNIALIASGDLSHCLKQDGPYGFNCDGPRFDQALTEALKKKDIAALLKLDEMFPEAGECGLRSFCFVLGILEAQQKTIPNFNYQPEILSYQAPFGVGYLVANFKITQTST